MIKIRMTDKAKRTLDYAFSAVVAIVGVLVTVSTMVFSGISLAMYFSPYQAPHQMIDIGHGVWIAMQLGLGVWLYYTIENSFYIDKGN